MLVKNAHLRVRYGIKMAAGDDSTSTLHSCRFCSPSVGWSVGTSQLLSTTDGGHKWVNRCSGQFLNSYIGPRVAFPVNPSICWVVADMTALGRLQLFRHDVACEFERLVRCATPCLRCLR